MGPLRLTASGVVVGLLASLAPVASLAAPQPAAAADGVVLADRQVVAERPRGRPAVVATRVIGRSVAGRPIRAWRLGEPGRRRIVMLSTMHGNEPHTRRILEALRDGGRIFGIDLWVVPTYNPDGLALGTRRNARGVDLNRNFPFRWADLDGNYESGAGPASEPETRAVMRFLRRVRPERVISFHQPLLGIDTDTKDPRFARRLARALQLSTTTLDCGGVCHGTMTGWFNHTFAGSALTVEYGARPPLWRLRRQAPEALVRVLNARRLPLP